jgi:hypothetical protein
MDKYNDLKALVAATEENAKKFYEKGNKTAGVKVRKALQDIKALAQDIRVEISAQKKAQKKD